MFEWLKDEMAKLNSRKFHLVDGVASPELRRAVETCKLPLPPSYREFVLQFGNAELYRHSTGYYVTVFAGPREAESSKGESFIQFGRTWTSNAYFKESLLRCGHETQVFEWFQDSLRKTADGFEQWLIDKCSAARRRFNKKQWEAIEKGLSPFTEKEQAIVEARKMFQWRVVGVAPDGNLRFEVHNGSAMTLPFLSLGVRGELRPPRNGPLNGGVWLPVSSVRPGQTKIIEKDCYKEVVDPDRVEVFDQPEPEPEDRDRYWEFKALA